MPKKRHQAQYSKPQSTPPPSLASSRIRGADDGHATVKGVNELLADLRRSTLSSSAASGSQQTPAEAASNPTPSVPPALRQVLQIPEPQVPIQPRARRVDARGRRIPPGPPAPRSWLAQSRHAPQSTQRAKSDANNLVLGTDFVLHSLPGTRVPEEGSLVDRVLSAIVAEWDFQRHYNKYWLYSLPDHTRTALIHYLGCMSPSGVSATDFRVILMPQPDVDVADEPFNTRLVPNESITWLDMVDGFGKSLVIKELSELLFPRHAPEVVLPDLQESWDATDVPSAPRPPLLANLTRLSLAVNPQFSHKMSWRQLLSFSAHLSKITHFSLAYWPRPTLTPNAVKSVVDSPRGTIQYGGTGYYSHSLDDDWSEAIMVLKRLSKNLYGLEYLDLTGCSAWTEALIRRSDHDFVDWFGSWGKITVLLLHWGFLLPGEDVSLQENSSFLDNVDLGLRVQRHIVEMRQGRGRFIDVRRDSREP